MSISLDKVKKAAKKNWEAFQLFHPNQARGVLRRHEKGDVLELIVEGLTGSPAYAELVAKTDAEVSITTLAQVIMPLVVKVIGMI